MTESLMLTVNLATSILNIISGVKTNHHECEELGKMTQNLIGILERLPSHVSTDFGVEAAVNVVNSALKKARCAIEDCRDTCYFGDLFSYRKHTSALKEALTSLQLALSHLPLAIVTKTTETHCRVVSMSDWEHRQRFAEAGKIECQRLFFKDQLLRAVSDLHHGNEQHTNNLTLDLIAFLPPDMYQKPLKTTTQQVEGIARSVRKVKTNENGCKLLERLVKETLEILEDVKDDIMSDIEAIKALALANIALCKAQDLIEDCCSVNCSHSSLRCDKYSSALQAAAKELHDAISKMPFERLGISNDAKSELETLWQEPLHSKFDEAIIDDRKNVTMCRTHEATNQTRAETSGVKNPSEGRPKVVGTDTKIAMMFHLKLQELRNYLESNGLTQSILSTPREYEVGQNHVNAIRSLVGEVCKVCMVFRRHDDHDIWDLISANPDKKKSLNRSVWRMIAQDLRLNKDQIETGFRLREQHLMKLETLYIQRQSLNLEAIKLLLLQDQGGKEPRSQQLDSFSVVGLIQRVGHTSKVNQCVEKLKENQSNEQKLYADLEYMTFYRVLTPLQGAWFTLSAYPHQCDCLALLNAIFELYGMQETSNQDTGSN